MAQKIYVVEGRKFRTEADYQNALKDQQVIENLRVQTKKMSLADQKKLLEVIRSGRCRFHSILGQDYMEELSEDIQRQEGKVPETSSAKGHSLQKENTKTIGKAQTPKNRKEASKKKETGKVRNIIGKLVSILLSVALLFGTLSIAQGTSVLDAITGANVQTQRYSVVVLKDSSYKTLSDLKGETIETVSSDR